MPENRRTSTSETAATMPHLLTDARLSSWMRSATTAAISTSNAKRARLEARAALEQAGAGGAWRKAEGRTGKGQRCQLALLNSPAHRTL